jgi:membrane-bound lytic murein transglycosylase D
MNNTLKTCKKSMHFSKLLLTFSAVVGFGFSVVGQINEGVGEESEEIVAVEEVKITYPYQVQVVDERDNVPYTIIVQDPEIVKTRLKTIENIMPMVYNESVEFWLHFFMQRRPNFTKNMMEETGVYFPIFEKILKEHNMPEELKYLAILESGLNPKAISRAKAVGLWQFMSFTGKEYGLTINENVDERMHPEKATDAACRYLKYLNKRFDDWDLALASYNTGQGRISRTMKKTGLSNYWDLHPHIPKDTRHYVPQFIALAYLMNFGQEHGIIPEKINSRPPLENIYVEGNVDLEILAALTHTDIADLQAYNPHLKKTILPLTRYGYEVALPTTSIPYFNDNRVAILDSASKRFKKTDDVLLASDNNSEVLARVASEPSEEGTIVIGRPAQANAATDDEYVNVTRKVKRIHKVKSGEVLSKIASRYDVSVNDIKRWNNKNSSKVLLGESLAIYVDKNEKVKSNSLVAKTSSENVKQSTIHTVRRGDTLWNISQKYEGVSVNDIKKWNNLKGNNVVVGQKIRIRS